MTFTEMEAQFENIDARLTRIEQILPTLATKADLERFATKDALEEFRQEFRGDLLEFRQEFRGSLEEFRQEFRGELEAHRQEFRGALEENRREFTGALEEFRQEFRGDLDEHRRETKDDLRGLRVLLEHTDAKVGLIAEHLVAVMVRLDRDR